MAITAHLRFQRQPASLHNLAADKQKWRVQTRLNAKSKKTPIAV